MKVGVIGSGIGGLAIAARLAAKGHTVTVFEKNPIPGGKLSELRSGGFRFDTGPSLFTLPELLEELFTVCGEELNPYFSYRKIEINCKYFFPDHTTFNFYQEKERLEQELEQKRVKDSQALFRRLENARKVYELSSPIFIFDTFGDFSKFTTPAYKEMARKLYQLDFFRTMHQANRCTFKDTRLVQLFDRYATYNGSDPYHAPATLNMIAHLENNIGAYFPTDGMYSIIRTLHYLCIKKGVQFRFNTLVEEVRIKDENSSGIRTREYEESFDCIVSDCDTRHFALHMLRQHPLKKRLENMPLSSSALIFYWKMNRTFPELELHNIFFSGDYKKEFHYLHKKRDLADDLTVYLFISCKEVKEDAPIGKENWFVMVNTPADTGQNWNRLTLKARKSIIQKISSTIGTDIEKYIEQEYYATPVTIWKNTLSSRGALYGAASNSMFSAFMRHPNHFKKIDRLYFVGGSVHPGGGIPLCLASAQIVDQEISRKYE